MALWLIAKSKMGKTSRKKGRPIVAHLATEMTYQPLCQAPIARGAEWLDEDDPAFAPERDCVNCAKLAAQMGLR